MKKSNIEIFMFIDALGWEIIKERNFLNDILKYRYPVKMQFGYSCTAIPTILTGKSPKEHGHLSFYYYDPENSPFKIFRLLKYLPSVVFDRWRVRHQLSKIIKYMYGYTGYFELYSMPFKKLQYFNYVEKKDLFIPNGIDNVKNIADELNSRNLSYHISDWRLPEEANINILKEKISARKLDFAFLYTAEMDSLLHKVTKKGKEVDKKLDWYEKEIRKLLEVAYSNYENVNFSVISDHGMTTLTGVVNVMKTVEEVGLIFGKDYAAAYDSTMAHFWYLNALAEQKLNQVIRLIPKSVLLNEKQKKDFGIDFDDNKYGNDILLMEPGIQIEPCDLGKKALPAMHGYSPEDKDSAASFLSNYEPDIKPFHVKDFFRIMIDKSDKLLREHKK